MIPAQGDVLHTFDPGQEFTARTAVLQNGVPVGMLVLSHDGGDVARDLDETPSHLAFALFGSLLPVIPLLILGTVAVLGRIEGQIAKRSETVQGGEQSRSPEA